MGTGSNEVLLGKAVKDFRDEVVLATKFGFDLSAPPNREGTGPQQPTGGFGARYAKVPTWI